MNILTMAIADAVAIAILCTLYMVRHRNRELMISYAVINAGIFTVSVALVSAGSNASAMGMGLFGVLSIIRLRSTALSQREVGYYFVALSVGMIAGVSISPAYIAFILMGALVALIGILDARSAPAPKDQTQTVTADRAISNEEELKAYLSKRLGYTITSAKVTELDLVNNLTRATITYTPREGAHLEQTGQQDDQTGQTGQTGQARQGSIPHLVTQAVAPQNGSHNTALQLVKAPTVKTRCVSSRTRCASPTATLNMQMIPLHYKRSQN